MLTWLVLVGFCLASTPIPVARVDLSPTDSQPFPCQDSPCGCKSAHQCWTNCCCHTPAKRLAWAREHGITPPAYAVLAGNPRREALEQSHPTNSAAAGVQAQPAAGPAAECQRQPHREPRRCCQSKPVVSGAQPAQGPHGQATAKRKTLLSLCALQCQGQSSEFTLLPWTILVQSAVGCLAAQDPGVVLSVPGLRPLAVFYQPDPPPPKG